MPPPLPPSMPGAPPVWPPALPPSGFQPPLPVTDSMGNEQPQATASQHMFPGGSPPLPPPPLPGQPPLPPVRTLPRRFIRFSVVSLFSVCFYLTSQVFLLVFGFCLFVVFSLFFFVSCSFIFLAVFFIFRYTFFFFFFLCCGYDVFVGGLCFLCLFAAFGLVLIS